MKPREVAAILMCSREHIYRMIRDGVLPATRLKPGGIRIPRAAFEAWLVGKNEEALAGKGGKA